MEEGEQKYLRFLIKFSRVSSTVFYHFHFSNRLIFRHKLFNLIHVLSFQGQFIIMYLYYNKTPLALSFSDLPSNNLQSFLAQDFLFPKSQTLNFCGVHPLAPVSELSVCVLLLFPTSKARLLLLHCQKLFAPAAEHCWAKSLWLSSYRCRVLVPASDEVVNIWATE